MPCPCYKASLLVLIIYNYIIHGTLCIAISVVPFRFYDACLLLTANQGLHNRSLKLHMRGGWLG